MMSLQALNYSNHHDTYSPPNHKISETEYWVKYYQHPDIIYEWHNGYLEEKSVSDFLTFAVYQWFFELLNHFLRTKSIAKTVGLEMGFRLVLPSSTEVRRPDLGVVLNDNPIPILPLDKSYHGTFDLCVEALSDSTDKIMKRDTVTKKSEYAQGGVKEYYILDGRRERNKFYSLSKTRGIYIPIKPTKDGVIKSKVLPGFQFRIEDLFNKPSPEEMIEDEVYKDFVLPKVSQVKKQAERLAEQLRALGVEPDI